jgi:GntR family transcriptional regulator, carbon starvation induced regulator
MSSALQYPAPATQADEAYAALRDEIVSCRLAPGSKIVISDVAPRLGLSPGAVREALSRLTGERMTIATAQKGYSVAEISIDELKDLTRTRITIEQLCLRAAIARGDVEWETAIVGTFHRLGRIPVVLPGNLQQVNPAYAKAHKDFHVALASGCESQWLLTLRDMLYAQTERYRHLSVVLAQRTREVEIEHKAILDACLGRQPDTACDLMEDHLLRTSDILFDSLFLQTKLAQVQSAPGP